MFNCLKASFDSRRTYGLFTSYFDAELYNNAVRFYKENVFQRAYPMYAINGIVKVIEAVEISQRNYLNNYMQRFIEQDVVKIPQEKSINPNFWPYVTARIDIQLLTGEGDFQIDSVDDDTAKVTKPDFLQSDSRIGYCVQSYSGKLEFVAKSTVDGQISILLRGIDKRYPEDHSKSIPYWIDYTNLTINDKVLIGTLTPTWHDKFYKTVMDVKSGEEIKIKVEWLPHRSDT